MFMDASRSAQFINLEKDDGGYVTNSWPGLCDTNDCIFWLLFDVSQDSKVITRTRRKFWDDVSLRGGQYSALMIVLTATYLLF